MTNGDGTGPVALDGLVVVDASDSLTGALASSFLADFGADVTMVEPPTGSRLRSQAAWPFWGRNKQSVALDLTTEDDRAELTRRGRGADVVIETWRPGVAERLGLGDADLRSHNPRLVYASITGFGRDHPWSKLKAYEPIVMAKTGGLSSFAGLSRRSGPSYVSTPYCTFSAAHLALHGILAALIERESSGLGQRVDTTMAQGFLAHDPWNWLLQVLIKRYDQAYKQSPPWDEEQLAPNLPVLIRLMVGLSADGRWLQFSQTTDRLWEAFLRITDLEWTRTDPRYRDGPAAEDVEVRSEFWALALEAVRKRTYDEWVEAFDDEPDVWAEVFRDGTELLHHPQLVADHRTTTIVDPEVGPMHQPGPLAVLEATPAVTGAPAPALGAHGEAPERDEPDHPGSPDATDAPLAGTTVLEFGTFFAAPYGATLLAELGARVIKVEQLDGDPVRHVMPFPELSGVKVLAGKQSVGLDVGTPEGHAIALDLVRRADVVLLAFRAGVAARLGIEPHQLREVNPGIIVLEAPGYGLGAPCGHRPAFAPTMGAGSGLAYRNLGGPTPGLAPLELAPDDVKRHAIRLSTAAMNGANADGFSALVVASTMLLGLLVRKRGGPGQSMSTSMLSTMAHVLSESMVELDQPTAGPRVDPELYGLGPWFRLYRTEDGWVFLAAPDVGDQTKVIDALDLTDAGGAVEDRLAEVFATRPAAAWEDLLTPLDVACVEVAKGSTDSTIMFGEAGRDLGFVIDAHHPVIEDHPRLAPLVRFSRSTPVAGGSSPACGDDTDAVLAELGIDDDQRARLRDQGVIT